MTYRDLYEEKSTAHLLRERDRLFEREELAVSLVDQARTSATFRDAVRSGTTARLRRHAVESVLRERGEL